jgi:hypothetical protein
MMQTASGETSLPGSVFESWNIGAVSVKRVRFREDGTLVAEIRRSYHPLDAGALRPDSCRRRRDSPQSVSFLSLPYLPESMCIEKNELHEHIYATDRGAKGLFRPRTGS